MPKSYTNAHRTFFPLAIATVQNNPGTKKRLELGIGSQRSTTKINRVYKYIAGITLERLDSWRGYNPTKGQQFVRMHATGHIQHDEV
jgi:hypothetical protein